MLDLRAVKQGARARLGELLIAFDPTFTFPPRPGGTGLTFFWGDLLCDRCSYFVMLKELNVEVMKCFEAVFLLLESGSDKKMFGARHAMGLFCWYSTTVQHCILAA